MEVPDDPPFGLLVHARLMRQGYWHVVEAWDSEDAYEAFVLDRLAPASGRRIERHGLRLDRPDSSVPESQMSIEEVYSLVVRKMD
jgi:hypothetical protein